MPRTNRRSMSNAGAPIPGAGTDRFDAAAGTLSRGLELLRFVNQIHPARVADLTRLTGLPKATISRLLHTMCAAGYIVQDPRDRSYRPSGKLRLLSAGVPADDWIADVAAPVVDRLSRRIQWPSDLATFEGRGMTIRYTTRTTAPITISEAINVSGLSMLQSDFGRAFLAFAADSQRQRIVAALLHTEDGRERDLADLDRMLAEIRARGYATRGGAYAFARASTIAVAVVVDGQAIAALNVICRARFIPPAEIPARFLEPLRAAAREIASGLRHDGYLVHSSIYDTATRPRPDRQPPDRGETSP